MKKPTLSALRRFAAAAALCVAMFAVSAAFVACSSDNDPDPTPDSADQQYTLKFTNPAGSGEVGSDDTETTVIDTSKRSGQTTIIINGPAKAPYTVSISDGEDWCFTSEQKREYTKSGELNNSGVDVVYIYYKENTTAYHRTAQVSIALGNQAPTVLLLRQQKDNTVSGDDTGDDNTGQPDIEFATKRWAELPLCMEDANTMIVAHYAYTAADKKVRNYTMRYNKQKGIAEWVAYPIHGSYMQGTYKRSDTWDYDPDVPKQYQANLARGSYNRDGKIQGNNDNAYVRGHQCMSNHRYVPYSTLMNMQTFYATNSMPQHSGFNSGLWNKMEGVCDAKSCADTLYCVTGNFDVLDDIDVSDKDGKRIAVPAYCFKVLLRTVKGNTGKAIDQFTNASELMAIGYIASNDANGNKGNLKSFCVSVAEVEKRTGFSFFPMLDDEIADQVKNQCDPSKWGIN